MFNDALTFLGIFICYIHVTVWKNDVLSTVRLNE